MMSQKQKVLEKLIDDGYVDNFWAIRNFILRLGAIIYNLRKEGYNIRGEYGEGKDKKNYFYYLDETNPTTTRFPETERPSGSDKVLCGEKNVGQVDTRAIQLCFRLDKTKSPSL